MTKLSTLLAGVALAAFSVGTANAATVVYQSVPDLFASPAVNAWCSDCNNGGNSEPLDPFTLSSSATITGVNYMAYDSFGYVASSPVVLEIYNASHSSILFSQAINPTFVAGNGYGDAEVTSSLSGLNLSAGSYWFGVVGTHYAVPGYSGGNGGLIDTTPHTGNQFTTLSGNTGYQLLSSAPEPATWGLMLLGAGMVGAGLRRRRVLAA